MPPAAKRRAAMPLTEARARLFPLVDDLLAGRTDRVALTRRGAGEQVLMVRARDLERLEAEVVALRRRVTPEPRPLRGMGRVVGRATVEEIVADIRRVEREGFDAKLREIFGDEPEVPRAPPMLAAPGVGPKPPGRPARRTGRR